MKKHLSIFLALVMLLACVPTVSFAAKDKDDYEEELNELSSLYDDLEAKQKAIQAEIDKAKSEKEKTLAQKRQIDAQISNVSSQINLLTQKIAALEGSIAEQEAALEAKQDEIDENYDLLKRRLRAMYSAGNASVLGMILGAESWTDFLSRIQIASRVAKHDQELITTMRAEFAAIEEIKLGIEADKAEVEGAKSQQTDKKTQLAGQLSETQDMIEDIEALEAEYLANKAAIDKAMKEAQAEIDAIYAALEESDEVYDSGTLTWPVKGYEYISSDYGWRFGGTDYHTGIDLAGLKSAGVGIYGQPIRAAASGRVIYHQTYYTPGVGYGIYTMVDHGGGLSTLYAHCSRLAVKTGDYVERGQTIAYVGSTGWSTGPHLHFEVRVNGSYTNPWPYLR
ncbi:MAG: peptidoglycan DD-metalloendopeptidase family protein [Oscillospiraceae bacterium]|nr:peptidoglycan DD-metalloendopeptidase family protein [Oscillospiraceae bacterium]